MPNPKTGKPQLEDYLSKEPRKRKPVDIFSMPIVGLPEKDDLSPELNPDAREELDGTLKFRK